MFFFEVIGMALVALIVLLALAYVLGFLRFEKLLPEDDRYDEYRGGGD